MQPADLPTSLSEAVVPTKTERAADPDQWDFLLSDGCLSLFDYFISDLGRILAVLMPRIRSGEVNGLHLHGEGWRDQDVKHLRHTLLPETGERWFLNSIDQHAPYAQQLLPGLTMLRITFGSRLTVASMLELASLSSLTNVDLSLWQAHDGSADGIQELIRLPKLQSIQLPISLQNLMRGAITRREILMAFFGKANAGIIVN